jgi:hypothetical protein
MTGRKKGFTVMVVPDGERATRSFRLSERAFRILLITGSVAGVIVTLMVGSWGFIAVRAYEAGQLERRVEELLVREAQVEELAQLLEEVEAGYGRLRDMFGATPSPGDGDLWIPPATGRPSGPGADAGAEALPTSWPLTERGFITQTLLEGAGADHPGIDIAVPAGSYIRAA